MEEDRRQTWKWRKFVLFFDCMIAFGFYFNIDVLSALQKDIQGTNTGSCNNWTGNTTCCYDCLGLGPDRFNQLYAAYSWMNACASLPGGYFIDKIGYRVSAIVTTTIGSVGTILFAVSVTSSLKRSSAMFPLMFCGRLLLGAGTGPALIVQNGIMKIWFSDKLALAFSAVVLTLRFGNVSNFFLTANLAIWFGITWALWIAAFLGCSSMLFAMCLSIFDYKGEKSCSIQVSVTEDEKQIAFFSQIRKIRYLPLTYWLQCISVVTFYSCYLPLVGNGSKYIQDRYGYSKTTSSYFNGAVYDVSIALSPFMGYLLRKYDCMGVVLAGCVVLTIPVFPLMSYCHSIHPLILTIYLGITYTAFAICAWPCLALQVPSDTFATAVGVVVFIQGIGVGMTNYCVGKILGGTESPSLDERITKYQTVFLLLLGLCVVSAVSGIVMNIVDMRKDNLLNPGLRKHAAKAMDIVHERSPLLTNTEAASADAFSIQRETSDSS